MSRNKVFISYSRRDRQWLDRLSIHLAVLERRGLIHIWSDTRIAFGADWQTEIENILIQSKVAVLLISPEFLASRYIWEEEMSRIEEHSKQGMDVLPLIVRPCAWQLEEFLALLQARPSYGRPLSTRSEAEIDQDLADLVYELAARVKGTVATSAIRERELAENLREVSQQLQFGGNSKQQNSNQIEALENAEFELSLREGFGKLPQSWIGHYSSYLNLRLTIRNLKGSSFQGSLEYIGEQTVTAVKGRFERDIEEVAADLRSEFGSINIDEARLTIKFRETKYEKEGKRQIRFDGEYRALVSNMTMDGGWFSDNGRIAERLKLQYEG